MEVRTNQDKSVKELLPHQLRATEAYSDVELTQEEIDAALLAAKIKKYGLLTEQEYREKISKPKEYPKPTAEQLGSFALNKIRAAVPNFSLDEYNTNIFQALCLYFTGDESVSEYGLSLDKGICLVGPVGCGKTTLMRCFALNAVNSFIEVSCRKVAGDYALKDNGGPVAIEYYSSLKEVFPNDFWGQRHVGIFFDDLGTEYSKKHFGNESNVMEEIILNRYDKPELRGKTHLTTNLTADQIEEIYGTRVRSRIREMFNWIKLDKNTPDRRK